MGFQFLLFRLFAWVPLANFSDLFPSTILNPYIANSKPYLRYFISTDFSQVYADGSALFYGTPQFVHGPLYREIVALIEGGILGAIVTIGFNIVEGNKSEKLAKGTQANKRSSRK